LLGAVVSGYLNEMWGIQSVRPVYWGAPVLNLFVTGFLTPFVAVTGSDMLFYVSLTSFFCGTGASQHDWFFEEGYSEEEREYNRNQLFGEDDEG
jgi:hypothetical protein